MASDDAPSLFVAALAGGITARVEPDKGSKEAYAALSEALSADRRSLVLEVQFTGFSSHGSRIGPVDPAVLQAAARLIVLRVNRLGFTADAGPDDIRILLEAVTETAPGSTVIDRLDAAAPRGIYVGLSSGEVYRPSGEEAEPTRPDEPAEIPEPAAEPHPEAETAEAAGTEEEAPSLDALEILDEPLTPPSTGGGARPPAEPDPRKVEAEAPPAQEAAGGTGLFEFFRSTGDADASASEHELPAALSSARDLAEFDALCQASEAAIQELSRERQGDRLLPIVVALGEEATRSDRTRIFRETAEKALKRAVDRDILQSLIEIAETAPREQRRRVLKAFIVIGGRGTDFLQRALLRSKDPGTRVDVFHALRLAGTTAAMLLDRTLEQSGPPAIGRVAPIARSHSPEDLQETLGWLQQAASHDDRRVRVEVARAIAAYDDPIRIRVLLRLLEDSSDEVRAAAIESLGEAGDPAAVPFLLRAVDDDRDEMATAAIDALGTLRAAEAAGPLTALIKEKGWLGKEKHLPRKYAALRALARIRTPAAVEGIRAAAKSKDDKLASAAKAMLDAPGMG